MKRLSVGRAKTRLLEPCAAALLFLFSCHSAAAPDMVLVNAKVFTADPDRPYAEALAIEAGRFSAIGTTEQMRQLAGPATRTIDVAGRLVTPGLVEAHVHIGFDLPTPPLAMPGLPFPGPTSEQALAVVEQAAKGQSGWICAWIGPAVARDGRNWRAALDAVAPKTPVLLRGFWGHIAIINSEAMRRIGIGEEVQDPMGGRWGRDSNGRLDGRAYESASTIEKRVAPPDAASRAAMFRDAAQRYARWGVTSIHLMNSDQSVDQAIAAIGTAQAPQKWTIYSWAVPVQRVVDAWTTMDAVGKTKPGKIRVEGPKWILDGTPLEQNAWRREAYRGRPMWFGRSNFTDDQLREILQMAVRRPEQMALHVVGDAETDRLLKLMAMVAPADVWRAKRVRLEHGDGIRADTIEAVARFGLVVTQNPTHLTLPGSTPVLRSLLTAGIPLALGSDAGADEQNPFLNMMLATRYPSPDETLSREQALTAYTSGGAYAEGQEKFKGRIVPGLAADLAVLSQDVLSVPVQAIPATVSLLTLVDGEIVYEDAAFGSAK